MKIIVSEQADERLHATADYIQYRFGHKAKKAFIHEFRILIRLRNNPYMGATETLLNEKSKTYRSIVLQKVNKMVYFIDGGVIHIADFWDTRREPVAQAEQVKE